MGTLKYAILGLLNRKNMTGYDLSKEFETTLFEFWNAKHSQIYPELKSLSEKGLVQYEVEITGNVLEKKVYSITEKGREDFYKWEESLNPLKPVPKDEFRLQLFFSGALSPEKRLALLTDQLKQHVEKLDHLKGNMEKFSSVPPEDENDFADYLVLHGAVLREETCCKWLKDCIRLCKKGV